MCLFCVYFVCILLLCTFATFGKVLDRKGNRRGIECSHFTKLPIHYRFIFRKYIKDFYHTRLTNEKAWKRKVRGVGDTSFLGAD